MSDFNVGDVVVCIDASPDRALGRPCPLKLGGIYRITKVWSYPGQKGFHVLVNGQQAEQIPGYRTPSGWDGARFRKLNDTADDAELIERIRKCKPAREPALATRLDALARTEETGL